MKVAIVGSRGYPDLARVARFIGKLPKGTTIVSGGANGVDQRAAATARSLGWPVVEIKPDWNRKGMGAGFYRNGAIVNAADVVIAFWDEVSRGTAHSIRLASDRQKPLRVCGKDGIEIPTAEAAEQAKAILATPRVRKDDVYDPEWEKDQVSTSRTRSLQRWARGRKNLQFKR